MCTENKNVDWKTVIPCLKKMGIYNFFCCINSVCVNYLGFKAYEFPAVSVDKSLVSRIFEDVLNPEFEEEKPKDNKMTVILFKIRRFFANGWKRKLIYREGVVSQLWHGSIAHLKRWDTIE